MKAVVAVLFVVAAANAGLIAAPATVISRAPALDSAVIKSDRIGGNFAYSVAEAHAYAAHTPVVQHVATPVAVSYSAPAVHVAAAPVAAVRTIAAAPAIQYAAAPVAAVAAPVAAVRTIAAAPAIQYAAAPLAINNIGVPAATVRLI